MTIWKRVQHFPISVHDFEMSYFSLFSRLTRGDSSGDISGYPQEVHHMAASESAQVLALGRLAAQRHQTLQYTAERRLPHQGV